MASNFIKVKLKALFMKDELVELYLERYGEILNLNYVEELKEELRCKETGETPAVKPMSKADYQKPTEQRKDVIGAKPIRIKLKAIFMKEHLVDLYLQRYGELINMTYVEELKEEIKALEAGEITEIGAKASSDPVFEFEYQCPVCRCREVIGFHLRSKSLSVVETVFLVPQFSGIAPYVAVDYNLLQTTVCPICLYASPDPKDWTKINKFNGLITESQINIHRSLIKELKGQEVERKKRYPEAKADASYFLRPRDYKKGIESIELSMMRAELEKRYSLPAVNYKTGRYVLKMADMRKKNGEEYKDTLAEAEKWFTMAVQQSDCFNINLEMESIYQVVALNLFLGNKEKAASFVKIAQDLLTEKRVAVRDDPDSTELKNDLNVIDKWRRRISDSLWENREDASFWAKNH